MVSGKGAGLPICWSDEDTRCPEGQWYAYDRGDFMHALHQ
jgi:hypothetical protein